MEWDRERQVCVYYTSVIIFQHIAPFVGILDNSGSKWLKSRDFFDMKILGQPEGLLSSIICVCIPMLIVLPPISLGRSFIYTESASSHLYWCPQLNRIMTARSLHSALLLNLVTQLLARLDICDRISAWLVSSVCTQLKQNCYLGNYLGILFTQNNIWSPIT